MRIGTLFSLGAVAASFIVATAAATPSGKLSDYAPADAVNNAVSRFRDGTRGDDIRQALETGKELDDRTNLAAQQKARYYAGRFYHREFDLTGNRRYLDQGHDSAYHNYKTYLEKYTGEKNEKKGKNLWASDTRFYKALVYLERNDPRGAVNTLTDTDSQADERTDTEIFVDCIRWTADRRYGFFMSFPARELKAEFVRIIRAELTKKGRRIDTSSIVRQLAEWCERERR